jgi:hypothetical protein
MKKIAIALTLGLLVGVTSAFAQAAATTPPLDTRWQPWIGCWQLLDERLRNDSDITANEVPAAGAPTRLQPSDANTRVCVAPAARSKIRSSPTPAPTR